MKNCSECGRQSEVVDGQGLCDDCHGRSSHGPDLTCAMLGRGEKVKETIIGVDIDGGSFGCCALCHGKYWAGEIQLSDGRWVEACCAVVRAVEKRKILRFTPFKKNPHPPVKFGSGN